MKINIQILILLYNISGSDDSKIIENQAKILYIIMVLYLFNIVTLDILKQLRILKLHNIWKATNLKNVIIWIDGR